MEQKQLIYIQFLKLRGKVSTVADVPGNLLFDCNNEWIGIEITNDENEDVIILPFIKQIDFPLYQAVLIKKPRSQQILFHKNSKIFNKLDILCNVDVIDGELFGIEIILTQEKIELSEVVKPFVKRYLD